MRDETEFRLARRFLTHMSKYRSWPTIDPHRFRNEDLRAPSPWPPPRQLCDDRRTIPQFTILRNLDSLRVVSRPLFSLAAIP